MQRKVIWLFVTILLRVAVLIPLVRYTQHFLRTDTCVDRGGRWSSEKSVCEKASTLRDAKRQAETPDLSICI